MDSCGFLPLHLRAALAGGDEPDACEDEQDGEDFQVAESVQAEEDGGCDGNDGLYVVVHAGDGRPILPHVSAAQSVAMMSW